MKHQINTFILGMSFLLLSACSSLTSLFLENPMVSTENLSVETVAIDHVMLNVQLKIKNPNGIALDLDHIDYLLKLNDEMVTEGVFENGVQIPAHGEGIVTVPLKFKYRNLSQVFNALVNKSNSKLYSFEGNAKIGLFTIPFKKDGSLKL